ncbi:Efflux pump membrane transporter BepE [Fundidesulfovibrio magnetotacticus]|uniref:Efflux pump membrane transporter BepE n=1 Tax=Fundidesulfovibrio magnetotacticus TaxID=2730080 RepID=A0A6V8LSY4_9BACT|nr:multidrug efflux RND transporter permease subunit [Fundidesulfovibrio magnetotacticus]GFK93189.1 Efflux pump membrane transporter BepE [Fundidesulfovibrio magnetotacticus]
MFSKFFIERPVLANVIAVVMMLLGAVSLMRLPVAQYPEITPPTVQVSTSYPGASPEVVAETVAAPLEQQINGVENMLYMSSKSSSDGSYQLNITFEVGTDLDIATVLVQNRANVAIPRLPQDVQRQGLTVNKQSTAILLVVTLESPDKRFDDLFLSNYAYLRIKDEISRINGVGAVNIYGADEYGMRIWLDPDKLKSLGLAAQDVVNAISNQNVQVASGMIGQAPTPPDQVFQLTIQTLGRLEDVTQFEDIIVKSSFDQTGRIVRVRDVGRVELGAKTYSVFGQKDGQPATCMATYLLPGANAIDVADKIKAKMKELARDFPPGLEYSIPFDTTRFVNKAIEQVYHTLFEAAVLVLVVIMVFLQNWRAMLVPATTVPVTILGAFVAMAGLGFSVNLITLFGIILAIGIVVDDAIIVVEGAMHHMEHGKNSHDAAILAMSELFGPIIGITLVLTAVFLPAAFLPGITGQLYRQFALVIASTAVISAINAATLKPTQCALWLKPRTTEPNAFFRGFNLVYGKFEALYEHAVRFMVGHSRLVMIGYAGLVAATLWFFMQLPTGFLPEEDQGYCVVSVQLPPGSSLARTALVNQKVNAILQSTPGLDNWVTFGGLSIMDNVSQPNCIAVFPVYKDWSKRAKNEDQQAIVGHIQAGLSGMQEAMGFVMVPPAIQGLGQAGGFEMVVQDKGNLGPKALEGATRSMMIAGRTQSSLEGVSVLFNASTPQIWLDVNRTQALTYGVPIPNLFNTLQTYLGSAYVNDFNKFGRVYQVRVQADTMFRLRAKDIGLLQVPNVQGNMVPLGAMVSARDIIGPPILTRYNLYTAASIYGSSAPGFSSGQALTVMEQMAADKLPSSMGFEWTGMSFQEKRVGSQAYFIFALAILLVYLVLCAQYESWILPTSVILVVPLALLGTAVAVYIRGMDNNVYTQIGVVLLIALASKNAILIVEFARELRMKGRPIAEAAVEAARLRFRPILMTSFAFILGVVPLLFASGAGGASQQAVGTAVFGGMIASTLLAVLVVPVFYVLIQTFSERLTPPPAAHDDGGQPQH